MFKYILIAVAAVLMSGTAFAGHNQGQGQDECEGAACNTGQDSYASTGMRVLAGHGQHPASSPGTLILGTCQAGVSANSQMGGGSLGGPDEVCLLFTLAQMHAGLGNFPAAADALKRADDTLRWRNNVVRRFFQAIPLIGRMF
jgi:hypothetical protein